MESDMTDKENKQQVVENKEVVEVMCKAHYECTGNSAYPSRWEALNYGGKNNWRKLMQAALKALTDNGYKVVRGNV